MDSFLARLFETGEVELPADVCGEGEAAAIVLLGKSERIWRQNLPGHPPVFDVRVATDASKVLMTLCQAVVYRETETSRLREMLSAWRWPIGNVEIADPSQHYSVDLLFRFLPQVLERARRISESDDLNPLIVDVLKPWPLSRVGVVELSRSPARELNLPAISGDQSLWQMYVDRVILLSDKDLLEQAHLRLAVAAALGPFEWLAPEMNIELKRIAQQSEHRGEMIP